jgi:hypothetical protein
LPRRTAEISVTDAIAGAAWSVWAKNSEGSARFFGI